MKRPGKACACRGSSRSGRRTANFRRLIDACYFRRLPTFFDHCFRYATFGGEPFGSDGPAPAPPRSQHGVQGTEWPPPATGFTPALPPSLRTPPRLRRTPSPARGQVSFTAMRPSASSRVDDVKTMAWTRIRAARCVVWPTAVFMGNRGAKAPPSPPSPGCRALMAVNGVHQSLEDRIQELARLLGIPVRD